jgi:hypothetical protein
MKMAGGRLWALGSVACAVDETGRPDAGRTIGRDANVVRDIARGDGGFWLATTQGAQFYPDGDAHGACPVRLGGLPDVSAVALCRGRVLAAAGPRLFAMWLDDEADEPFHSDEQWLVRPFRYDGKATAIDAADGLFFIAEETFKTTWAFNPDHTQWLSRQKRQFETNRTVRVNNPLVAREGAWEVRYDPVRKGIRRVRVSDAD